MKSYLKYKIQKLCNEHTHKTTISSTTATATATTTILWFTGLCLGLNQISQYQKVNFAIFWIFWCKMMITQADGWAGGCVC